MMKNDIILEYQTLFPIIHSKLETKSYIRLAEDNNTSVLTYETQIFKLTNNINIDPHVLRYTIL